MERNGDFLLKSERGESEKITGSRYGTMLSSVCLTGHALVTVCVCVCVIY